VVTQAKPGTMALFSNFKPISNKPCYYLDIDKNKIFFVLTMKLVLALGSLLSTSSLWTATAFAFTPAKTRTGQISNSFLRSTETDSFAAFADSLDEDEMFDDDDEKSGESNPSWQQSLEMLLDPSTPASKRQILLSDLLNANDDIKSDVQNALKERKIDSLLTPTGKKLQDGTRAVARQITTDILPSIAAAASSRRAPTNFVPEEFPTLVPKIGSRIFDAFSNQARKQLETFQADLADPKRIPERISKQTAEFETELKNIFLETPEGLVGPKYTVVSKGQGYEIREYEGYKVASTSMSKVGEPYSMDNIGKGGAAFNALAAYLFGGNDEGRVMDMTTPVSTTSVGEMRFYLKGDSVTDFPQPIEPEGSFNEQMAVKVIDVPPARLAVARFTGFVTEGEVARQKDTILSSLALDGIFVDAPHGAVIPHIILQYNPPYTIPIVRRNEIAVPVRSEVQNSNLGSEWQAAVGEDESDATLAEDGEDDGLASPSDVE
jgi:hypothetical protein